MKNTGDGGMRGIGMMRMRRGRRLGCLPGDQAHASAGSVSGHNTQQHGYNPRSIRQIIILNNQLIPTVRMAKYSQQPVYHHQDQTLLFTK